MANCNPVVPVLDWTEYAELHRRYVDWKEEVELDLGSSLSNGSNSVKSKYVFRWAGKPARDYLKSLPESEFKYEGAHADAILAAPKKKTKPKSNEIAAFTKFHSLKQRDMPLLELIREARRLAELCNYPNDQDRLIRGMIVSGIHSLIAYQKCIDTKDLSLQDCINICQAEDAIRMQMQECRPESVNSIQSAHTTIQVQRLQDSSKQSSNFNRHKNKFTQNCYYCVAPNWARKHSKVCKAKNCICGKCGKKGHLDSLCRSNGTPIHMLEAQHYSHPQCQESPQDYNQNPETAQYSTPECCKSPVFQWYGELPEEIQPSLI